MQTRQVALRERCDCSGAVTRRRFLLGATATRELGIPPLARAAWLAAVCGLLVALTALPAGAQTWNEATLGDASAVIPGQYPTGSGTVLNEINGDIGVTSGETADMLADLFCVKIPNLNQFTATVTNLSLGFDSISLFLFDNFPPTPGRGITMHAGPHQNQPSFFGYMPSINGALLPPGSGEYWLGVAHGRVYPSSNPAQGVNSIGPFTCPLSIPLALYSTSGLIWDPCNPGPMNQYPNPPLPNGPGGAAPLTGWPTVGFGMFGTYKITLTGAGFCNTPCTCLQPPCGMVAWWPMDELAPSTMAKDIASSSCPPSSVNQAPVNNVGTYMPAVGAPVPDPLGGKVAPAALSFNGTTAFVDVPDDPEIDLGQSDFTIDAWVKCTGTQGLLPIVDKRTNSLSIVGYSFFVYNNRLGLQMADGLVANCNCAVGPTSACTNHIALTGNVCTGGWNHVAVTVKRFNSNQGGNFFLNGAPIIPGFDPKDRTSSLDNGNPLWIGRSQVNPCGTTSFFWNGGIDEVEIFKRELAPLEIMDIWLADKCGKCKSHCSAGGCDDGVFCNGCETADPVTGECRPGDPPCEHEFLCDEKHDTCRVAIPTVSQWGLVVLTLVLLAAAKVYFGRRAVRT